MQVEEHKQFVHGGLTYGCDECEFTSKRAGARDQRFKTKHKGLLFPCDECQYKATQSGALNAHKKRKHPKSQNSNR